MKEKHEIFSAAKMKLMLLKKTREENVEKIEEKRRDSEQRRQSMMKRASTTSRRPSMFDLLPTSVGAAAEAQRASQLDFELQVAEAQANVEEARTRAALAEDDRARKEAEAARLGEPVSPVSSVAIELDDPDNESPSHQSENFIVAGDKAAAKRLIQLRAMEAGGGGGHLKVGEDDEKKMKSMKTTSMVELEEDIDDDEEESSEEVPEEVRHEKEVEFQHTMLQKHNTQDISGRKPKKKKATLQFQNSRGEVM